MATETERAYMECDCECGAATGVPCEWSGDRAETVVVEWMPEHLRDSHEAAGGGGTYPANGALRLRVHHDCADMLCESDADWCERT